MSSYLGLKMSAFNVEAARARFPALKQDQTFLENAGGSQTLDAVIDSSVYIVFSHKALNLI